MQITYPFPDFFIYFFFKFGPPNGPTTTPCVSRNCSACRPSDVCSSSCSAHSVCAVCVCVCVCVVQFSVLRGSSANMARVRCRCPLLLVPLPSSVMCLVFGIVTGLLWIVHVEAGIRCATQKDSRKLQQCAFWGGVAAKQLI